MNTSKTPARAALLKASFLFAVLLAACTGQHNPATERQLHRLLKEKDFFRLEARLENDRSQLSKSSVLYFEAHLQNAFNRTEQSLQSIDALLGKYKKSLNDTLLWKVYNIKSDNYNKQYRYREAFEALKTAVDRYGHAADSAAFVDDAQETYDAIEPLQNIPPQKMHLTQDVTVPVTRNQFGHLMMQVTCGGQSEDFIFDTGAMMSTISESCARQMGVRVLESAVKIGNSTGGKVASKVGVADSLRIGGLLVENVAFLVMSEMLSFPEINYTIRGIVGFPVMYQMREIRIHKDESITVPARPVRRNLHNLFLDGLAPVVLAEAGSDTVLFTMDTGANTSEFSEKYFNRHKNEILGKAALKKSRRGGAGGIVDSEHYMLENVGLKIGGRELTLPSISVLTDNLKFMEDYDGNLGQDVLMHFNKLILNFENMYLTFED